MKTIELNQASLQLMNKRGLKNHQIISLTLEAQGINFKYDGTNLNTYASWRAKGYQVKRGQKAFIQCELWTPCKSKIEVKKEDGTTDKKEGIKIYLKKASLFTPEQVKKIK